jgi:glycosyltransferase involved in cell wall biosynthesis
VKTVFHYITSLNIGGTEKFLQDVVMATQSDYINKIGYIKEYGAIGQALSKRGIPIIKLPSIYHAFRYIKKIQPDLIHTHLYRANIIGRIAGRLCGIPVISSRQSTDTWRKPHHIMLDIITSRLTDKIIVNSKDVADIMLKKEKVPPAKIEVVYIGIPEDWFADKVKERLTFTAGFAGRLHPEKGADFLPMFADIILKEMPEIKIKIAGNGILMDFLADKLPANCELLGWRQGAELKEFYESVDVIFLLSRLESFPRVMIEAGARGTPAIAPDIGGISEFVEDGVNGYLYEPLNLRQVSLKLKSFYQSNIADMRSNVLNKARRFTKGGMIREIKRIYTGLLIPDS